MDQLIIEHFSREPPGIHSVRNFISLTGISVNFFIKNGEILSFFNHVVYCGEGIILHQRREGYWVSFLKDNSQIESSGIYIDGLEEGYWIFYYPDGMIFAEGSFFHGLQTGSWIEYHPNKKIKSEGIFFEGKPIGNWSFWDEDGNIR